MNVIEKYLLFWLLPTALVMTVAPMLVSSPDDALAITGFALVVLWMLYTARLVLARLLPARKSRAGSNNSHQEKDS